MLIGMRSDVVSFADGAANQCLVSGMTEITPGYENAGFDMTFFQCIKDRRGSFTEVSTGEDQCDALVGDVASDNGAVVERLSGTQR